MPTIRHSLEDLPPAQSALLWLMRTWVVGHCRQQDVSDRLRDALSDLGAPGTFGCLDGFMWVLARGATRPVEVLCLCRKEVSADERDLLDAFALLQDDEPVEAHALLCAVLPEQAATVALRSAEAVAEGLAAAGLLLPAGGSVAVGPRVLH